MDKITFMKTEYILCAAIHYDNGLPCKFQTHYGITTGFVLCGYRHPDILEVLPTNPYFLKNLFEDKTDNEAIQKYEELRVKYGWQENSLTRCTTTQGFLTSHGRFVNRKEAFPIAMETKQIDENAGYNRELFTEDLY